MHSYEIALEDWWVPAANLIGEDDGLGRGFYYQMEGFENGRAADRGPGHRRDAGRLRGGRSTTPATARCSGPTIVDYQLTRAKLGRMAVLIQAGRQFATTSPR